MSVVGSVFSLVVFLFFLALIGRIIFDWVQLFARDWRPRGPVLVVAEGIYSVTDPPLKLLRRVIPTVDLGGLRIDLAFLVLMIITSLLLNVRIG